MTGDLAGISTTELHPGERAIERFVAEATAVGTEVHRTDDSGVVATVAGILAGIGPARVAVTDDLRVAAELTAAVGRDGGSAVAFGDVCADRVKVAELDAIVTGCVAAIAATGSLVLSARTSRIAGLIPPVHVCVVYERQVVDGLLDALRAGRAAGGSAFAIHSGPSRTADIEKILVTGVHGPGRVAVVLVRPPCCPPHLGWERAG